MLKEVYMGPHMVGLSWLQVGAEIRHQPHTAPVQPLGALSPTRACALKYLGPVFQFCPLLVAQALAAVNRALCGLVSPGCSLTCALNLLCVGAVCTRTCVTCCIFSCSDAWEIFTKERELYVNENDSPFWFNVSFIMCTSLGLILTQVPFFFVTCYELQFPS